MKLKLLLAILLISTATLFADIPKAGDTAPQFTGTDQNGKDFKLADLVGKKIVLLYFYPKDFSGVLNDTTMELCDFRDGFEEFATNNVEIIGISFDSADRHLRFIATYKLNFTLLADTDGKIADIYGVRMAGKNMVKRVSFLIGLDGKIVQVTDTDNPNIQLAEIKNAIASLKKN